MRTEIMTLLEERLSVQFGLHERQLSELLRQLNEQQTQFSRLNEQWQQFEVLLSTLKSDGQPWAALGQSTAQAQQKLTAQLLSLEHQLQAARQREVARNAEIHRLQTSQMQLASALQLVSRQQDELSESVLSLISHLQQ